MFVTSISLPDDLTLLRGNALRAAVSQSSFFAHPRGAGITMGEFPQIIIVVPNIATLHSTI